MQKARLGFTSGQFEDPYVRPYLYLGALYNPTGSVPGPGTACLASGGGGAAPSSDPPPPPVDLPTLSPSKTSGVGDPRRPLLPELRRDALEKRRTGYAGAALLRCAAKNPPLISVRPGRHPVHPWSLLRSKVFCPLVVVVRGQSKARKPLLRHADEVCVGLCRS